jgi:hypothetical protein
MWLKSMLGFACMATLSISAVVAQHDHDGDIRFIYDGNRIAVLEGDPGFEDGSTVYERDLLYGGIDDGYSAFPGFISEIDMGPGFGIPAGDTIRIEFLTSRFGYLLNYWDPVDGEVKNTLAELELAFELTPPFTTLTSTSGGGSFVLGQSVDGDFHKHFDYQLTNGSIPGAYAILARLSTDATGVAASDPFYIVFGYGITSAQHGDAAAKFAGVPEPGTIGLLSIGALAGLVRFRRRVA